MGMMANSLAWLLLTGLVVNAAMLVWLLTRSLGQSASQTPAEHAAVLQALGASLQQLERALRQEISESQRGARQEHAQSLALFQQTLTQQSAEAMRSQRAQMDAFALQLTQVTDTTARRMDDIRQTLNVQMAELQTSNAAKLDEMRATVDEKLQATLHARLGESFKQVAERLEQVHKGLGEMQSLAQGVGDLKHLLSNVKTRGIFGEAQLASLLEQVLVADQYAAQVATVPGSRNVVDIAIRLPGKVAGQPVWLPIDAKFPNEDYARLLDAQERADAPAAEAAGRALEARIRQEAQSIAEKYVAPPYTTDFAILFLPSEGLYAEVLRRPGLMESLQRDQRVTLAGPTTLLSMLSALQMGFRTLALEKRSSEVWQVLGAVKTEFGKFGDVLARVKTQTETVLKTLDQAHVRSRAMGRALRAVESLPESQASHLLAASTDAPADSGESVAPDTY